MEVEDIVGITIPVIKSAGELAGKYYKNPFTGYSYKKDGSFITPADPVVEEFIREEIGRNIPGCQFLGEEFENAVIDKSGLVFIIDPIDGTHSFATKMPGWCVSIGVYENGHIKAGFIYAPIFDELYWGGRDFGAYMNNDPIEPCVFNRDDFAINDTITASSGGFRKIKGRFPGKIRSMGSTALHLCLAARGASFIAQCGKVKIWDIAGALGVLEGVGCTYLYADGSVPDIDMLLNDHKLKYDMLAGPRKGIDIFLEKYYKSRG